MPADEQRDESAIGIVVIGRNEGARLRACLRSVCGKGPVVYVDSGSTDGSQQFARDLGMTVIELDVPPTFTAARARNAGLAALTLAHPGLEFIQMVDGDCEVAPAWLRAGSDALAADPSLAGVFGRRRERFPERSIYNRICDDEWNVPIGPALATGGDALFRAAALSSVGGFNERLIAGEEPDLCLRLRRQGWRLARIDAEMTLHDAAMTRLSQWWRRSRRAGHAYAEHVAIHGAEAIPEWVRQVRRSVIWADILPAALLGSALLGLIWHPLWWAALALALVYPAQIVRLALRDRMRWPSFITSVKAAALTVLAKFSQLSGMRGYARDRRRKRQSILIEYK